MGRFLQTLAACSHSCFLFVHWLHCTSYCARINMRAQMHLRANRDSTLNLSFLNQRTLHFLATLNHTGFYTTPKMCLSPIFFSVLLVLDCVCRVTLAGSALDWKCVGRRIYGRWNSLLHRNIASAWDSYILGIFV